MAKNYQIFEHTADIGIRVKAGDLKELFRQAAQAVFDIIAERQKPALKQQELKIKQNADTIEELFVNWLNELLSLSAVNGLIFNDFRINELDENHLKAVAFGGDIKNYKVNVEVKAATYHNLKIEKVSTCYQVEVILDV